MAALRRTALAAAICLVLPVISSTPASAARSLTVTPSTDLVHAQAVSVSGTGFTPGVQVAICQGIMDSTPSQSDCGWTINSTVSQLSGAISFQYRVTQSMFVPSLGRTVDCWVEETCVIAAAETDDIAGTATFSAPLTFVHVQPDARIRRLSDSTIFGDDEYYFGGSNPPDQNRRRAITPATDWSFALQIQNDGNRTDDITVRTIAILPGGPDIRVRYFAGWFDVTSYVTDSGFTFANVPPGGIRNLPVQFRASSGASIGSRALHEVFFTSDTDPHVIDRVQLDVRVVAPTS